MHKEHMKRCIELAKIAEGKTSPNPMVGAVVVDENGKVIAEGYHKKSGEPHAEVNALNKIGKKAEGCTLYVNLEPCCHHGKTPPCSDLIIRSKIKKLVVGMYDPNPLVSGKGIQQCRDAGIEVIVGILEEECRELNEIFIKYITKKQPFIAIKTATTLDGKIATRTGSSKWITGEESREKVQHLRNRYDAILTSSKTVIEDNPALTCRIQNGRNPIRIILDSELKTSVTAKVYENTSRVIIATKNTHKTKPAYPSFVEFIECPTRNGKIDLSFLAKELYNRKISSVLIEAGGTLNGAFLRENLVDKIYHFIAPKIVGDSAAKNFVNGINILDITNCILTEIQHLSFSGNDVIIEYCVKNKS